MKTVKQEEGNYMMYVRTTSYLCNTTYVLCDLL